MLKLCQLKATCSQTRVMPFKPHEPHVTLVEYDIYLHLFIFIIWIKILDWYQIARVWKSRLVINQSVVPVELESSPKERSVFPLFAV
jgi:hypothetical protein